MFEESSFSRYVRSLKRYRRPDELTERRLTHAWSTRRDPQAARALIESHLSFVVTVAYGFAGYGIPVGELVGEGNIGLMEALERFDPARNVRFVSYAVWWIRARILEYIQRHWSIVRMPLSAKRSKLFFRLTRERAQVMHALGHEAPSDEVDSLLSARLAVSADRVREMAARLDQRDLSLDAPSPSGTTTLMSAFADGGAAPDDDLSRHERARIVQARLERLTPGLSARERYIVRHRLLGDEPATLEAIAARFTISRERVRQIEERLKRKLRDAFAELAPDHVQAA